MKIFQFIVAATKETLVPLLWFGSWIVIGFATYAVLVRIFSLTKGCH
jgi:hypothetical protein